MNDKRIDWYSKPIRSIQLDDGRVVNLVGAEIIRTYGGMIEGSPTMFRNARTLERLQRDNTYGEYKLPKTQILPETVFQFASKKSTEYALLPEIYILMSLHSEVLQEGEGVGSWMKVAYFCDIDSCFDIEGALHNISKCLKWEENAIDYWP